MARDLWLAIALLAVVAGAVGFWWFQTAAPDHEPVPLTAEPAPPDDDEVPKSPRYPLPDVSGELVELPPLSDSDGYFAIELEALFSTELSRLLVDSNRIERFVATVDNLPRDSIGDRARPLLPVAGSLLVENGQLLADNGERYDLHVELFLTPSVDSLVDAYVRFYPLLQEAYVEQGYPNGHFNDRLIEVIDHLLATPEPESPLRLVRPHVLYEFEDQTLEQLSFGQKTLLRLGTEHRQAVHRRLRALRARLSRLAA